MSAVLSVSMASALAATARAQVRTEPRATCAASEFWSAASPQEAWIPVRQVGKTDAAGATVSFAASSLNAETPVSLTVRAQLGVAQGSSLTVHKLPAGVSAISGATTRTVFRGGGSGIDGVKNPLNEAAHPELFVTGWRVTATLYRRGCAAASPAKQVRIRHIFLFQRRYALGVGWVGTHATAHPVYGLPWKTQSLTNP